MVLLAFAAAARIGQFVAKASPAAFKVIDATCQILESNISASTAVAVGAQLEESAPKLTSPEAIFALKAACEVRKALRRRR